MGVGWTGRCLATCFWGQKQVFKGQFVSNFVMFRILFNVLAWSDPD